MYIVGGCLDYVVGLWPRADNHQLLVRHTCKGAYDEVHFFIRHHTRSGKVKIFFVGAKRKVIYRHARVNSDGFAPIGFFDTSSDIMTDCYKVVHAAGCSKIPVMNTVTHEAQLGRATCREMGGQYG